MIYIKYTNKQIYNSFTIKNKTIISSTTYNFYNNKPKIQKINQLTITKHPNHFKNYKTKKSKTFKININSYKLNYHNNYKKYTIINNKIPLSSTITYITIKHPTKQKSNKIYLTTFNNYKKYYTPKYLIPKSKPPQYKPYTKTIKINIKHPKKYTNTFNNTILIYFNFHKPKNLPTFNKKNIPIIFYYKKNKK